MNVDFLALVQCIGLTNQYLTIEMETTNIINAQEQLNLIYFQMKTTHSLFFTHYHEVYFPVFVSHPVGGL